MRGSTRNFSVIILFMLLMLVSVKTVTGVEEDLLSCSTAITNLTWSENYDSTNNENNSYFKFQLDYQISNPNQENVTLYFPNLSQFVSNMTIVLENSSIVAYESPWGTFPAISEKKLQPGITKENTSFKLTIEMQDVTSLLDGIYTIWVDDDRVQNTNPLIVHNKTILTIEDGVIIIDYGTTIVTLGTGNQKMGYFLAFVVLIPIQGILKKKMNVGT